MYPNSPGGHLRLFTSALLQMALAMSPPLAIGAAWSIWAALRSRERTLCFLLLPAISYYLCFISVVMYQYDRFFLGIIVIASIATGWWLQQWTAAEGTSRRWKLALVTVALLYAASRGIALDVLMLRDARYDVERRLREIVLPHQHVAATGSSLYLPRPGMWPTRRMEADLEALHRTRPDFLVRNAAYARRFPPGSPAGRFHDALESGRAGYRLGGRYRTAIPFSPLALEGRFREVREDEFSNLTKVNPAIEIYVRD